VTSFVQHGLPPSVRILNVNYRYYTIRRDPEGRLEAMEEWPERRASLHAKEWLEVLGCEDALWDDFSTGGFQ